ncbi:aldose 1-epimerase [Devosia algicola]|uniref:Aldose 1-epimerase n=1 Tax=Devosia algicola TaxID=3026418 RepID=A0ABY7YP86_9HYPH|nr:aldose 1-epimerase [Devosia algicola]WDR03076.1 aldose 1-epimerase [Devosia algicola]
MTRFDWIANGVCEPLFRPSPANGTKSALDLAAFVLLPWSNRVSDGGFDFEGKHHRLDPNIDGEPYPSHGNAFELDWHVAEVTPTTVSLVTQSSGPGPYRYAATLGYGVDRGVLTVSMTVENRGDIALPFGLGFHPWLVREPDTQLQAPATSVWLEDSRHLPVGDQPAQIPPDWNFSSSHILPSGFINNAFIGWDCKAYIDWPMRDLSLAIATAEPLSTYIVYSPSASADFFCFEPVSHAVDAFHLPGGSAPHGMVRLAPGENLSGNIRFAARHGRESRTQPNPVGGS